MSAARPHGIGSVVAAGAAAGLVAGGFTGLYVDLLDTEFEGVVDADPSIWTFLAATPALVLLTGLAAALPLLALWVPGRRAVVAGILAHLAAMLISIAVGFLLLALGPERPPLHPLLVFLVLGAAGSVAGGARRSPWPFVGAGLLLLIAGVGSLVAVPAALPTNSPYVFVAMFTVAGIVVWTGLALLASGTRASGTGERPAAS